MIGIPNLEKATYGKTIRNFELIPYVDRPVLQDVKINFTDGTHITIRAELRVHTPEGKIEEEQLKTAAMLPTLHFVDLGEEV